MGWILGGVALYLAAMVYTGVREIGRQHLHSTYCDDDDELAAAGEPHPNGRRT